MFSTPEQKTTFMIMVRRSSRSFTFSCFFLLGACIFFSFVPEQFIFKFWNECIYVFSLYWCTVCLGWLVKSCLTRGVDVKCVLPAGFEQVCSSSCLLWPCLFSTWWLNEVCERGRWWSVDFQNTDALYSVLSLNAWLLNRWCSVHSFSVLSRLLCFTLFVMPSCHVCKSWILHSCISLTVVLLCVPCT